MISVNRKFEGRSLETRFKVMCVLPNTELNISQ
ncbi:hypothetical protein DOQ08_00252 [Marinobacter litoralis]|uniref:Uncharacterized protein n=1 Tax=Marinobacter litoralis TaxID=187981 RepID=A0A3M2RK35_9GAMM|nr:hypothetical protein DOQ08_00252 [Marinobacter litoralis]